ncbi:MAG: protein phosphatase 2C domain-containing protein [Kangiellaceae bacterium]|nr:protein phosphatase 2C domain-containing protein [Kangiellaceae bacterium]
MTEQNSEKRCDYAQATDVGCVRELNEDSIHSADGLWIVADGMGGHACGEVASAMAIEVIDSGFASHGSLDNAIQTAHQQIVKSGKENLSQSGMGTTVVAMTGDQMQYQIAWVGDSRAYLWDKKQGKLTQLSEDHSLMVRLINAGLITPQDAITHPQRHMITQCLGSTEIASVKVDQVVGDWESHQQIILCSDGLTDEVSDTMISEVMNSHMSIKEKTSTLIKSAKNAGGRDNISLIIIESPIKGNYSIIERIKKFFGI